MFRGILKAFDRSLGGIFIVLILLLVRERVLRNLASFITMISDLGWSNITGIFVVAAVSSLIVFGTFFWNPDTGPDNFRW